MLDEAVDDTLVKNEQERCIKWCDLGSVELFNFFKRGERSFAGVVMPGTERSEHALCITA